MIDLNDLSNEEIEQIVEELENTINAYLEDKKDEVVFLGTAMSFNIPNSTDDEILDTILDIVCYNLRNELMKSFDASLVEQQELVDILVLEYLEELFEVTDLRRKRKWKFGRVFKAMKENIRQVIWGE